MIHVGGKRPLHFNDTHLGVYVPPPSRLVTRHAPSRTREHLVGGGMRVASADIFPQKKKPKICTRRKVLVGARSDAGNTLASTCARTFNRLVELMVPEMKLCGPHGPHCMLLHVAIDIRRKDLLRGRASTMLQKSTEFLHDQHLSVLREPSALPSNTARDAIHCLATLQRAKEACTPSKHGLPNSVPSYHATRQITASVRGRCIPCPASSFQQIVATIV